jgi:hypothetical protein
MVSASSRSEWEEASLRTALWDAAPLYRDSPSVTRHKKTGMCRALALIKEAPREFPAGERALVAALVMTTVSVVGRDRYSASENPNTPGAGLDTVAAGLPAQALQEEATTVRASTHLGASTRRSS